MAMMGWEEQKLAAALWKAAAEGVRVIVVIVVIFVRKKILSL